MPVFSNKPKMYRGKVTRIAEGLIEFEATDGQVYTFDIDRRTQARLQNWIGYYPNAQNPSLSVTLNVEDNTVIGFQ